MKVRNRVILAAIAICGFGASYILKQAKVDGPSLEEAHGSPRIVTMAPSSGEVVFALGLADNLVGVSRYMRYPEGAQSLPKIGGYLDVDLESLVRLKPTSVVILKEQSDLESRLEQFGMECVVVDHMSISGIMDSIETIGQAYGKVEEATLMRGELQRSIDDAGKSPSDKSDLRVLISIGRDAGNGGIGTLTAAGVKGYHQELLDVIGVQNAYQGTEAFPQLSREHLLVMKPDIIIDLYNSKDFAALGKEMILSDWQQMGQLDAVVNKQVYALGDDVHFIPGPRFVQTLKAIQNIVDAYEQK